MSEKVEKKNRLADVNGPVTTEARKTLLKDARVREEKCKNEIDQVLKQNNCRMDYYVVIRGGQYPIAQGSVVACG